MRRRYHFNSNVMSADGWRQRRQEAAWLLDRFSRVAARAQSCERSEKDSRVICFKQTAEAAHCCNLRQGESVTTEKVSKIYVCRLESTRKFQSIIIAGPSQTREFRCFLRYCTICQYISGHHLDDDWIRSDLVPVSGWVRALIHERQLAPSTMMMSTTEGVFNKCRSSGSATMTSIH